MDDPFAPRDGRVDVKQVTSALRDAIRRRREEPQTPVEVAVAERLGDLADEAGIDPDLLSHLITADGRWNISPDYRVTTHRKGLEARAVLFLKALLRPVVRLYTDPIVVRQSQVNLYLLEAVRALLGEVTRLERAVSELEGRLRAGKDGAQRP